VQKLVRFWSGFLAKPQQLLLRPWRQQRKSEDSGSQAKREPDPAPGVVKACYYLLNNASQFSGPGGYTYCGSENQTCSFAGAGVVAFGVNGLFNYQTFTGGAPCNTATFGDPDSGVVKACYYRAIR